MNHKPIINVTDARRLIGATAVDLSDDEVREVISDMDALGSFARGFYRVQKTGQPFDSSPRTDENGSKCNEL